MKQEFTMEYYPRLEQLFLSKNFENIRLGRVMLDGFKKPKTHKNVLIHYIALLFLSGDKDMMAHAEYLFRHLSSKYKYAPILDNLRKKVIEHPYAYREATKWWGVLYSSSEIAARIGHLLKAHNIQPDEHTEELPKVFRTIDLTNQ